MSFKTRRQIVSSRDHFAVHDYSDDAFTYHCHEGCPGHDVRSLDCEDKTPKPAIVSHSIIADLRAEEDAELDAQEARDAADDRWRDEQDTMGGIPPDAPERAAPEEERD